ncbi:MAG TPA: type II toxin-antitoxin system VapC family toxin [Solirubrobacteraceae bacterium]|nr:type II toxin-antitoxin system VapC family toxin [Solirubrobacteraceae bacterium]
MSTLVVDASFAVYACGVAGGFDVLDGNRIVAPPLMWSEARSAIRETVWREEVEEQDAAVAYGRLGSCPVERREPSNLHSETWRVAVELGWAKTYDAEYVALARLLECRLVTLDGRLRRGADRLGLVITPDEL